jgi:excisionase family DNA binding protein
LRLLLDEHYTYKIAEELRRRGIEAVAIQHERPELAGQDDTFILRTATTERRVVVTNNVRDYAPLVEDFGLHGETHFGVIFTDDVTFPRTHAGIGMIVRALAAFVLLGVSAQTVRARIRNGRLFATVRGRRYRVPLASFMQYLGVPPQIRVTRGENARRIDDDEFVRAES